MQKLLKQLFYVIEVQRQMIIYLCFLAFGKEYKPPKHDRITDKKYLKLSVDPLSVFEKTAPKKIYNCEELIAKNSIKPVKCRGGIAVHNIKISHQTIANYCNAVAPIVKPFVDHFNYQPNDQICGGETHIKIDGKWHYIFFFFDAVKKIR